MFLNVIHIVGSVSLKVAKCSTSESIPLLHKSYNIGIFLLTCLLVYPELTQLQHTVQTQARDLERANKVKED